MAGMATAEEFLKRLAEDRRKALTAVRAAIVKNLPKGYEEQVGSMLNYVIPLARYPKTYNKQPLMLAAVGSQKNHMAIYLVGAYIDPDVQAWFEGAYKATGKKFDMGKSCVRFKTLDDLPLEVIGEAIRRVPVERYVELYEKAKPPGKK